MISQKKILVIVGSATKNSSNQKLMEQVLEKNSSIHFDRYDDLSILPHFDTSLTDVDTPEEVVKIRERALPIRRGLYFLLRNIFSVFRAD
ncbi:NADPH-dependent FMN reductase [Chryseobacterium aurantiacum]|uniref:NADPH-dependent FMN reductase n=1 Tax=Chryseobacterium aurantiacum TaxID=2116499 RepID=UPI000D137699|nr:NAD(P)H-dependent oxidoreductase [Chryseobacterium aurantiacum]